MWGAYASTRFFRQVCKHGVIQLHARQGRGAGKVLRSGSIFSVGPRGPSADPARMNVTVQGEEFECLASEIAMQSFSLPAEAISFALFIRTEGRDPEGGQRLKSTERTTFLSRTDITVISQFLDGCRSNN